MKEKFILVYVTCADKESAKNIANILLESKLIACANIIPTIESIYRYNEEICQDQETLLICKTMEKFFQKIVDKVKEIHNYNTPCVISTDINSGSKDFLDWIKSSLDN